MSSAARVDVSVIIVNYNTAHLQRPCLDALRAASDGISVQTLIVDNASRDDSVEVLRRDFADCELIVNDVNVGFGRANNQAVERARGRFVLLLNTDAFVPGQALSQSIRFLDGHPTCGNVGGRLVGRDGVLQPSCRYFPTPWNEFLFSTGLARWFPGTRMIDDLSWDHQTARACDWVPGCYYFARKDVLDAAGLFDPRFFLYYEEVNHCRTVKSMGWQVMYDPAVTVVHLGGESARSDAEISIEGRQIPALQIESSLLYFRKYYGRGGAWAALVLSWIGAVVLSAKVLLKGRPWRALRPYWRHAWATWTILRRTSGGLRPTR